MSEYLQSDQYKKEILKGLIRDLHNGRDFQEVKREFGQLVQEVDASEIADMEQQLIEEGMHPDEIKKLCDVHSALFRETLTRHEKPELTPGHPLHTLRHENDRARGLLSLIESIIDKLAGIAGDGLSADQTGPLKENLSMFYTNLDKHFSKKENIFFPYLERHNITGPPSVMWSVDNEIRDMVKGLVSLVNRLEPGCSPEMLDDVKEAFTGVKKKCGEMFFKEEEILTPMMEDTLTENEWAEIKEQSDELFGVACTKPGPDLLQPDGVGREPAVGTQVQSQNVLELDTGRLTPQQVNAILTNIPVDITFVDENDQVAYFSQGRERIFTRTRAIIGRKVQNCHPPQSVHVVEKIINDFKSGRHSNAHFWLELDGRFIHIRYEAIRDSQGKYIGTMEVTQDLTELRSLTGERRLLHYSD